MGSFLLDTHEWLWLQNGDAAKLKAAAVRQFTELQRRGELFVSAVSIWEIAIAVSKERLYLGSSVEDWVQQGLADDGLQLLPLTPRILIESTRLADYPHGDPGDRMLIATAREQDLTLITRDDKILAYGAEGHVKVLKR